MNEMCCYAFMTLAYWKDELSWLWKIIMSGTLWTALATVVMAVATAVYAHLFQVHPGFLCLREKNETRFRRADSEQESRENQRKENRRCLMAAPRS